MRTLARFAVGWFFVLFGYQMWESTISPYWAGWDGWNLIGAGFFWFAVAVSVFDMAGTARDAWIARRARRIASH